MYRYWGKKTNKKKRCDIMIQFSVHIVRPYCRVNSVDLQDQVSYSADFSLIFKCANWNLILFS